MLKLILIYVDLSGTKFITVEKQSATEIHEERVKSKRKKVKM